MAIDGIRVDEPFYISSAGSADEVSMQHDGSNFLINNDTGLTKFGNGTTYQMTIDNANGRIGIGTESPNWQLHMYAMSSPPLIRLERNGGAETFIDAGLTDSRLGSVSAHPVQIFVGGNNKMSIDTGGNVRIPAAYTTIIDGTNTALYIDSTGLIGPNPSSIRFKENIRELKANDTNWIYQIPIKKFDMKKERGGEKNKIGLIAEEIESIYQKAVRYAVHEITESGPILLNNSEYDLSDTRELMPGIEREDIPVYRKKQDENGKDIKIKEWKKLILLPFSVNLTDFIIPMLKEIQKLKMEVDILKNG